MKRLAVLLAALTLVVGACSSDDDTTSTGTTGVGTTAGTTGTTVGQQEQAQVLVYLVREERVAPVAGEASADDLPAGAVEDLLAGPDEQEADWGYGTEIPEGTELLGLEVDGGVATVDLSEAFTSGGGSLSMQARVAQVVFTLTQFDDIDAVAFRIDGEAVTSIGGEGVMVDPPVDRDDMTNVRPIIEVTSPLPGEEVSSPLTLAGESATFEATVQVSVVDGDGIEVYRGFITSTGANGVWGPFEETVTFTDATPGLGAVIFWEDDPSGELPSGRTFEVEIPVRMG